MVQSTFVRPRPVEHQLHRIPKALTGQATEQAMVTRTEDSTQVYITYNSWNMKVLVFDFVMDLSYSSLGVNLLSKLLL